MLPSVRYKVGLLTIHKRHGVTALEVLGHRPPELEVSFCDCRSSDLEQLHLQVADGVPVVMNNIPSSTAPVHRLIEQLEVFARTAIPPRLRMNRNPPRAWFPRSSPPQMMFVPVPLALDLCRDPKSTHAETGSFSHPNLRSGFPGPGSTEAEFVGLP